MKDDGQTLKNDQHAAAVKTTLALITDTLSHSSAFQQIDERLFVIKQGSAYVMVTVQPYGDTDALVRLAAQVVTGIEMSGEIATRLLRLNTRLRFGTFGYQDEGSVVTLSHAILGGETLTGKALLAALEDLALLADDYDDKLVAAGGGARMEDLLNEEEIAQLQRDSQRITEEGPIGWDEQE